MYSNREFPYIFVYCFSCRYVVELGLRQLGLPVPNPIAVTDFNFFGIIFFNYLPLPVPTLIVLEFGTMRYPASVRNLKALPKEMGATEEGSRW